MQTSLITYVPITQNGIEPPGEGMRIDAALRSRTTDSLFTTILQKELSVTLPLEAVQGLTVSEIPLVIDTEDVNKTAHIEPEDVRGLLIQLMVMHPASPADDSAQVNTDENVGDMLGRITQTPGALPGTERRGPDTAVSNAAVSAILENDGKAAEVLSALAASKTDAEKNGRAFSDAEGGSSPTPFQGVLAGITDALRNELKQDTAASDAAAITEATVAAAAVTEAAVTETAASAAAAFANVRTGTKGNATGSNALNSEAAEDEGLQPAAETSPIETAGRHSAVPVEGAVEKTRAGAGPADDKNAASDGENSMSPVVRARKKDIAFGAPESGVNGKVPETGFRSETAAEKTTAVERALNRFTDDLLSIRSGTQEIQIVLEPESLGVLIISVTKTESGISAKIKSEDKEVAAIISDQVHKLISSMESKGITVNDVDVTYSPTEQQTGFAQRGFSQARDESSRGYALPPENAPDADAPDTLMWQTLYGGEASGDATVEYRV